MSLYKLPVACPKSLLLKPFLEHVASVMLYVSKVKRGKGGGVIWPESFFPPWGRERSPSYKLSDTCTKRVPITVNCSLKKQCQTRKRKDGASRFKHDLKCGKADDQVNFWNQPFDCCGSIGLMCPLFASVFGVRQLRSVQNRIISELTLFWALATSYIQTSGLC